MKENGIEFRMSKVENGVTRRETTTIGESNYDVIRLEKYLETHPDLASPVDISLDDERIYSSVLEGNTYWSTESGEKLGPSHFLNLWNEKRASNSEVNLDEFLTELKFINPDWIRHIESIEFAKSNLDRPIWLYADEQHHTYPFDGMHRLTRAYLENRPFIKAVVWESLPDEAKLEN